MIGTLFNAAAQATPTLQKLATPILQRLGLRTAPPPSPVLITEPRRGAVEWNVWSRNSLGNNIVLFDRNPQCPRWVGWTTPRPQAGDIIQVKMRSGAIGRFLITHMELCRDPHDMWFANTSIRLEDGIAL